MEKYIIWGAGKKGRILVERLHNRNIKYFIDNDSDKVGRCLNGVEIKSIQVLLREKKDAIVIATIHTAEVEDILSEWGGKYYYFNEFLDLEDMKKTLDDDLYNCFCYDKEIKEKIYFDNITNWYRKDYYNLENQRLITSMKLNDYESVNEIFDGVYVDRDKDVDEYYSSRPGMRLARRIINNNYKKAKILDLACGHGEILHRLQEDGFEVYGCDYSSERVNKLKKLGMNVSEQNAERLTYPSDYFDVVICMECLEHVNNVVSVRNEILRVLKKEGLVIITVPYLKNCDCPTHVRQFDEVSLASLFGDEVEIVNIIKTPYLNWTQNDNIFYVGKK